MGTGAVSLGTKALELFNEYNTDKTNAKMAELLAAGFAINAAYDLVIKGKKFSGVTNGLASAGLYKARVGFQHRTFDEENATYHAHNKELKKTNEDLKETERRLSQVAKEVQHLTEEERKQLGKQVEEYQKSLVECRELIEERHKKLQELNGSLEDSNRQLNETNRKLEETTRRIDEKVALLTSALMESALVIDTISKQIVQKLQSVDSESTNVPAIQESIGALTEVIQDIASQLKKESQK